VFGVGGALHGGEGLVGDGGYFDHVVEAIIEVYCVWGWL
jgi:hypothetical protein